MKTQAQATRQHRADDVHRKLYQTQDWRRPVTGIRARVLTRDPFCRIGKVCVELHGDVRPSVIADHIIPIRVRPELQRSMQNLQGVCFGCHNWKIEQDNQRYGAQYGRHS
jgi:5-methylcytosine-specific restriction endonuclease McrA